MRKFKSIFDMTYSRFINLPPRNPTQTHYTRFLKGPSGEVKTNFTEAIERFNKVMNRHKTVYEKYVGDLL